MLSTWSESCKSCITRVTGRVRCMSQKMCDICGLQTGSLRGHKDKAVSYLTR